MPKIALSEGRRRAGGGDLRARVQPQRRAAAARARRGGQHDAKRRTGVAKRGAERARAPRAVARAHRGRRAREAPPRARLCARGAAHRAPAELRDCGLPSVAARSLLHPAPRDAAPPRRDRPARERCKPPPSPPGRTSRDCAPRRCARCGASESKRSPGSSRRSARRSTAASVRRPMMRPCPVLWRRCAPRWRTSPSAPRCCASATSSPPRSCSRPGATDPTRSKRRSSAACATVTCCLRSPTLPVTRAGART